MVKAEKGPLNENFVASRLLGRDMEIHYWRTKSKAEIDFVVEDKERKIAFLPLYVM